MSVVLWTLYINWEAAYGQPPRTKDLVFRAMRDCPWSKGFTTSDSLMDTNEQDLAMETFGLLAGLFDARERGRVYNVMMEKEIRILGELSLEQHNHGQTIRMIQLPIDKDSDQDD
jgi:hypothetical protein